MKHWPIVVLLAAGAARLPASVIYYATPTPAYTSSTTLLPILDPEGSIVTSESDGNLTISFLSGGSPLLMDVDSVPDSWSTWGSPPDTESSTPMVLTPDDGVTDTVEFQFSSLLTAFGMELEPNDTANSHEIDATFLLGGVPQAEIDIPVNGNGGAMLFAAAGGEFDSVVVSSDVTFGAAEFRYAEADAASNPAPEPGAWLLTLAGLVAIGWRTRRHQPRSSAK